MYEFALFVHLIGVLLYFAGLSVAAVAHGAARRRERPSEIALLLRQARLGVRFVAAGAVLILVFGLWLTDVSDYGFDDAWVPVSLALFVLAMVLGAVGGRRHRHARVLAERLAEEGDTPSAEVTRLLENPVSVVLNYAAVAAALTVLLLMVWKPGS